MTFPLRTDRLVLRFFREDDIETLTAYRNDPAVAALQDWALPHLEETSRALVERHVGLTDFEAGRGHQIAIEHEGRLVGDVHVGLDEHLGVADIGFSLIPDAQGQGIAHEAVDALLHEVIERLGVHRVVAELSKDNLASARLLERLGLTFESFSVRSFWWRGEWDDNVYYSMSADQWRRWRARPRSAPDAVRLVAITEDNRKAYARLAVHRSQERFVSSVQDSYADALFPERHEGVPLVPVLRGIEADGEPVGFLMYAVVPDDTGGLPFLWRFLVDRLHQGRGIGAAAIDQWFDAMRAAGHDHVETSWVEGKGSPQSFHLAQGFTPTGDYDGDEAIGRRPL